MRAFAAGIVLSLALVHILPESMFEMGELAAYMPESHPYNPAGAIAVAGVLFMVASDALAHAFLERKLRRRWAGVEPSNASGAAQPVAEGVVGVDPAPQVHDPHNPSQQQHRNSAGSHSAALADGADAVTLAAGAMQNDPHTHVCMGSSAHHQLAVVAGGAGGSSVRSQVRCGVRLGEGRGG
jgi:hypothetical protein